MRILLAAYMGILLLGCTQPESVRISQKDSSGVIYSGGNGESFQNAVVISGAKNKSEGVAAEYRYISNKYGQRGSGWLLVGQTIIREKNKVVDVVEIQLNNSTDRRIFYFDVSEFLTGQRK